MSKRDDVQKHLATLYQAGLVGTGLPVQVVLSYKTFALKNVRMPAVLVSASSTDYANPITRSYGNDPTGFDLDVFVFARYSDDASGHTTQDAEEQLAQIEQQIREINQANKENSYWSALDYRDATSILTPTIEGVVYKLEEIYLRAHV